MKIRLVILGQLICLLWPLTCVWGADDTAVVADIKIIVNCPVEKTGVLAVHCLGVYSVKFRGCIYCPGNEGGCGCLEKIKPV